MDYELDFSADGIYNTIQVSLVRPAAMAHARWIEKVRRFARPKADGAAQQEKQEQCAHILLEESSSPASQPVMDE